MKNWRGNEYVIQTPNGPIHIFPFGLFIRDFLLQQEEAYPSQIWQEYRKIKEHFTSTGKERILPKRQGSYQTVRNYIYWLESLGLIEKTKKVEMKKEKMKRKERGSGLRPQKSSIYYRYYRITEKGKKEKEMWKNPKKALYGR